MKIPATDIGFDFTIHHLTGIAILAISATVLGPFIGGDGRNYLLVASALLSPLLFIMLRLPVTRDLIWVFAILLYMSAIAFVKDGLGGISSVAYSALFMGLYLCFAGCLETMIPREAVLTFFRRLVYIFCTVSILQMLTSLVGLPVPNHLLSKGLWSYNSLALEPSHLGRVLSISILTYFLLLQGLHNNSNQTLGLRRLFAQERKLIVAFLISIFLSGSALAIIAAPVALVLTLRVHWVALLSIVLVVLWPILLFIEIPALQRGLIFLSAVPTLDILELVEADHSGATRVMPILIYFDNVKDIGSWEFWLGGGVSSIMPLLGNQLIGVAEGNTGGGFFPGFVIAYGLLGSAIFALAFLFRFLTFSTTSVVAFWLLLFGASSAWNSQLFWYGLLCLRLVYHYSTESTSLRRSRFAWY